MTLETLSEAMGAVLDAQPVTDDPLEDARATVDVMVGLLERVIR